MQKEQSRTGGWISNVYNVNLIAPTNPNEDYLPKATVGFSYPQPSIYLFINAPTRMLKSTHPSVYQRTHLRIQHLYINPPIHLSI